LNGTVLTPFHLFLWIGAISVLGVFIAIPMKRQMINIDQLPFPSGIAAAETIKSLHGHGEEAIAKAKSLGIGGLCPHYLCSWSSNWHCRTCAGMCWPF
jgi:uncharacterized oligopeptide transporter (OPT) family protein